MANARHSFPSPLLATVAAAIVVAALWIAEPFLWTPSLVSRCLFGLAMLVIPLVAFRLASLQAQMEFDRVERYLEMLFRIDLAQLSEGDRIEAMREPTGFKGWKQIVNIVQNALLEQTKRLEETEICRQNVEVRLHRVTTEKDELLEIVAGLTEPILAVDRYGEILLANDAFVQLFGLKLTPGEKTVAASAIHCQPLVDLLEETRRRKSMVTRSVEINLSDSDGRNRWYKVTCRAIVDSGETRTSDASQPHGTLAVLTDVTAQKVIQKRNAEFVSAVSHEMKTPLSSIKAYVELLADGEAEDDQTREEFLSVINGQTDRLQRLIDNLLNIARIEAGVVSVNKESRSLNGILHEAFEVMRPAAEKKHITLQCELSPLYLGVLADRDTLLQAAINLISNAVKYTREGGKVTLRSRTTDDTIQFEVEDSGVGLNAEDCQKVFEKFYRVKKDKDMAAGTGLGLPLVKHIIEDVHSGRVEVRSELGVGSTFRVCLPPDRSLSS